MDVDEISEGDLSNTSFDELDCERQDNGVWLVKIPKFLAESWALAEKGEELGILKVHKKTQEVIIEQYNKALPAKYHVDMTNQQPQAEYVFTTSSTGEAQGLVGTVGCEASLTPVIDDQYRELMRERQLEANKIEREVKKKDAKDKSFNATRRSIYDTHDKKKVVAEKRERMDREPLLNLIFQAFEERPRWRLNEMGDRTAQPLQYLKEILKEMCIQNRSGPHAGTYELKDDYKNMGEAR